MTEPFPWPGDATTSPGALAHTLPSPGSSPSPYPARGPAVTYRLMDGASGRPGVGSSGTQPPAAGTTYAGNYIAGLVFKMTQGSTWFQGYWWYVAATNQDTSALKFALWQVVGNSVATLIPNSTVTASSAFSHGWNYVPLSTPLALTPTVPYLAAVGGVFSTGFPLTKAQFGAGDPYAAGVTHGPLSAYPSGVSSSFFTSQQPFSVAGSDPAVTAPFINDVDDLLWLDVQVTTTDPGLGSYRTFPNMLIPFPNIQTANDVTGYTLGMQFSLTRPAVLKKIWHYSPQGLATDGSHVATALPTRCAIWNVGTTSTVSGTDNTTPAWLLPGGGAASPGAGWVYCDYSSSGVTLAASTQYKVSTFHGPGAGVFWFGAVPNVWDTGEDYASGITQGPLVVPNNAGSSPGQQSWNTVTWGYPATSGNPEADYIDVEVS